MKNFPFEKKKKPFQSLKTWGSSCVQSWVTMATTGGERWFQSTQLQTATFTTDDPVGHHKNTSLQEKQRPGGADLDAGAAVVAVEVLLRSSHAAALLSSYERLCFGDELSLPQLSVALAWTAWWRSTSTLASVGWVERKVSFLPQRIRSHKRAVKLCHLSTQRRE